MLPAEKRLKLRNAIALQMHLKAEEVIMNEEEELDFDRMLLLPGQEEGKAGSSSRRNEAMLADAEDAAAAAMNQLDAESRDERVGSSLVATAVKNLEPLCPTVGRGMSDANAAASNRRRTLVHSSVYEHLAGLAHVGESDGFRQFTGFHQAEFDGFYEAQGGDRGMLFGECRNHQRVWSDAENVTRRRIRGTMCDRDRVICWLIMLRKGLQFDEMEAMFGPSKSTFVRDLQWMTILAQDLAFLNDEIVWPNEGERRAVGDVLSRTINPLFANVSYIVDGTKVGMRNPSKPPPGQDSVHDTVHALHYSHNKGLAYSHIVYTNPKGKIIRVETVRGAMSDRAAHTASPVFLEPEMFLAPGEVGMGDGNYRGQARIDDPDLEMCVPHRRNGELTGAQKSFNSCQRQVRVVVENKIGQIKKWKIIGIGDFSHARDFEVPVFEVCAKLTARIMRVRDRYPRSLRWMEGKLEEWEAKLGIYLWMDYEESTSYLVHGRAADLVYERNQDGDAALLQSRWNAIWDMEL